MLGPPKYRKTFKWYFWQCHDCMKARSLANYYANHEHYKTYGKAQMKARRQRLKDASFAAYGGYKCACCGETEKMFLSLDHKNNDGGKWRKETFGTAKEASIGLYRWLAENKYPDNIQVLCMNCNVGKHKNGGICPHQVRRNDHSLVEVGSSEPKRATSHVDDEMISTADESGSRLVN